VLIGGADGASGTRFVERETRFELATSSLEGCTSHALFRGE
jgi:hypothetical protein